ncbi:unnamed protein product [Lepidochelys kempii]
MQGLSFLLLQRSTSLTVSPCLFSAVTLGSSRYSAMKTLYLLFAVACLVFHVQASPKPLPEDVPENLDAAEDDGIGMEDGDIAKDPDVQVSPFQCLRAHGVCRPLRCHRNEGTIGRCFYRVPCCSK